MKKLLIVYYSWSNGNTERIAKKLQSIAGGNLLRIDTAVPYSGSYNDVVEQGQQEVNRGYEPALKRIDVDITAYDVIAVGTPTWWYTMAPAVKTFLHRYDFAGKTVVPFMTNAGWPGHVIQDIAAPRWRLPPQAAQTAAACSKWSHAAYQAAAFGVPFPFTIPSF